MTTDTAKRLAVDRLHELAQIGREVPVGIAAADLDLCLGNRTFLSASCWPPSGMSLRVLALPPLYAALTPARLLSSI